MKIQRMLGISVAVLVTAPAMVGVAAAAPSVELRAFDENVDVRTLTADDVAALRPADLPNLPPQVRKALVTPVAEGSDVQIEDNASSAVAARAAALGADVCYTLTRDTWKSSSLGNRLLQVRNKARVCTDDGVYISETPIDLSQAWGNWGWVFSAWETNTAGYCSSSHLKWYHLLNGRFRYGPAELLRLANQATFLGSGGIHGGYC